MAVKDWLTLEWLGYFDTVASFGMIAALDSQSTNAEVTLIGAVLVLVHFLLFGLIGWVQHLSWDAVSRLYRADLAICAAGLMCAALLPFALYVAVFTVLLLFHLRAVRATIRDLDAASILDALDEHRCYPRLRVARGHGPRAQQ